MPYTIPEYWIQHLNLLYIWKVRLQSKKMRPRVGPVWKIFLSENCSPTYFVPKSPWKFFLDHYYGSYEHLIIADCLIVSPFLLKYRQNFTLLICSLKLLRGEDQCPPDHEHCLLRGELLLVTAPSSLQTQSSLVFPPNLRQCLQFILDRMQMHHRWLLWENDIRRRDDQGL